MADDGVMDVSPGEGKATSAHARDKIHHTVTACVRCRQRKTRCDPSLPRCEPCERSNSHCEYYDSAKNKVIPRTYITSLQDTVKRLQAELKVIDSNDDSEPDRESMARAPGLVRFSESDELRFLGPSSGIAVTRFVMDFARRYADQKTIRDVVPAQAAQQIKRTNDAESEKPTSKVYPLISSVAAPNLPNRGLMEQLLNIYMVKAQYMLPLLHEPTFRQQVDEIYNGSSDAALNFQVRMVIAISMQKLDTQYAGLADSYYLAALPFLGEAVARKDLATLQCFTLMAQYSLLTPTRTAAYWVVGMSAKLAQDLGLCDEKTIDRPPLGTRPNFLEIDMRRRAFWIATALEYGLSHSLGRPSAMGVSVDNINVGFFQLCDDRYISAEGLLPGHHAVMKKCIAVHFLKMRLLQAEIRRTLYLRKREKPLTDRDPWFSKTLASIDNWVRDTPKNDEGSGLGPDWFVGRKNTMIIMMYRPCPQIPNPTAEAADICYRAAIYNIRLQKEQVELGLIDITWIFTQAIFMALNTVLWCLSYGEMRHQYSAEEVEHHIREGLQAIALCADRWPGVISAHQIYQNLLSACLKAYEVDKGNSPNDKEAAGGTAESKTSASTSQSTRSPASTAATSFQGPQSPQSYSSYPSMVSSSKPSNSASTGFEPIDGSYQRSPPTVPSLQTSHSFTGYPPTSPSELEGSHRHSSPEFHTQGGMAMGGTSQALPSWESMTAAPFHAGMSVYSPESVERAPWLADFGMYAETHGNVHPATGEMQYQMQSLTEQEQLDLMESLENSHLPDVSGLMSDSTTFYTAGLP